MWLSFQYGTNIDFHVEEAIAVRFLYFSTACGIDGIIQKNKLMTAKISLDKNQQTVVLTQTIRSGLLRQNGSTFYVDPQTISWGEYKAGFDHIRVFSQSYRRFCENTTSQAELKRIYYLIQMIPYLNRKTNILAHNQTEQDPKRLAQLGTGIIGFASFTFLLFLLHLKNIGTNFRRVCCFAACPSFSICFLVSSRRKQLPFVRNVDILYVYCIMRC